MFEEIRNCKLCTSTDFLINVPQPGYLVGNKVLYLGQNPGMLRYHDYDLKLRDKNITEEDFNYNYLNAIKLNKNYMQYINAIYNKFKKLSILNVVKCPTMENTFPSDQMITNCEKYLVEQIHNLNPVNIIAMGKLAQDFCAKYHLQTQSNIIYSYHYSYLAKIGKLEDEAQKIKEQLKLED